MYEKEHTKTRVKNERKREQEYEIEQFVKQFYVYVHKVREKIHQSDMPRQHETGGN